MPKAILYQAKAIKVWLATYCISQRTTTKAETKANKKPTKNSGRSLLLNRARCLYKASTVAPNNVGIAKKKLNSVAAVEKALTTYPQ